MIVVLDKSTARQFGGTGLGMQGISGLECAIEMGRDNRLDKAIECGMNDHLTKPIEIENLRQCLESFITPE